MGQTLADRVLIAKSSDGEMNDLLGNTAHLSYQPC